jgi:hypothetical protein
MIQMIVAMTIAILRWHDGVEHNTHQNDTTIITKKNDDDSYSYGIHILM